MNNWALLYLQRAQIYGQHHKTSGLDLSPQGIQSKAREALEERELMYEFVWRVIEDITKVSLYDFSSYHQSGHNAAARKVLEVLANTPLEDKNLDDYL